VEGEEKLKRLFSGIMLILLMLSMLTSAFDVQPVKAIGTIYIRADGSIDPSTAPISSVDNVTYTFTDNINDSIIVERDNIVVDGASFIVQGMEATGSVGIDEATGSVGIDLSNRSNVTIKNTNIKSFYFGIMLDSSSNNSIAGNNITSNEYGVYFYESSNNNVSGNNITSNNDFGVEFDFSSYNTVSSNNIANNMYGVFFYESSHNTASGNNVANNTYGIELYYSSNNSISGNNITANNNRGVNLRVSSNNTVSSNNIANNMYGVYFEGSSSNNVSGNTFVNDGLMVLYSYENIVTGNLVNGKPLVYLEGFSDYVVENAGQVVLVNCVDIRVENLDLSSASVGVLLQQTNNTEISSNNIANNMYGVYFEESSSNNVSGNSIITNNVYGICLDYYSSNNSIAGNNITNNTRGILLSGSNNSIAGNNITNNGREYGDYGVLLSGSNNSIAGNNITNNTLGIRCSFSFGSAIYLNNFINNARNAFSYNSSNLWSSPQPMTYIYNGSEYVNYLGNYWNDYSGIDVNNDGVGDTAYSIDDENDYYPLMQPSETYFQVPSTTELIMTETASSTHALTETIICQNATLNTSVAGDLNGVLSFTNLEIVFVNSGSFAGKGFSKGNWSTNIEGNPYEGSWQGMLFKKPEERKIHLKGMVSGGLKGIVEGFLSESVNGSEIYDQYQATWTISHIGADVVFAKLNLNGTVDYQETVEYSSELYALQTLIQGEASGYYDGSLSVVLTHIRIDNATNPYCDQGFSIISYIAEFGSGEGWTYDKITSPSVVELNGLFTDPLMGIISGKLDESGPSRTLSIAIERINLGLPPQPDMKATVWGPERVSPGQTLDYVIEFRNDGLKSAKNMTIVFASSFLTEFISASSGYVYDDIIHMVRWDLSSVSPQTKSYLHVETKILWGLPDGSTLGARASALPKEWADLVFEHDSPQLDREAREIAEEVWKEHVSGSWESDSLPEESLQPLASRSKLDIMEGLNGIFEKVKGWTSKNKDWLVETWVSLCDDIGKYYCPGPSLPPYQTTRTVLDTLKMKSEAENAAKMHLYDVYGIDPSSWSGVMPVYDPKLDAMTRIELLRGQYDLRFDDIQYLQHQDRELFEKRNQELQQEYAHAKEELKNEFGGWPSDTWLPPSIAVTTSARDPNIKYGPEGYVSSGQRLDYKVEFENEGEGIAFGVYFTDTLDEDLNASTLEIGPVVSTKDGSVIAGPGTYNPSTRTITWLVGEVGSGEGGYANFSAKVKNDVPEYAEIINYATVYFPSVPETTRTNAIVSVVGQPSIAVTNVTSSESVIEKGSSLNIDVTVANKGYYPETFNLTLYANTTVIQTQNVTLPGRNSDTITFTWNTTDSAKGNYTISAYAMPVPSEAKTDDNLYIDGTVQIKVSDDVPPITVLDVGEPKLVIDDMVYLTSSTPITLTAEDNPDGSGIAFTSYKIRNSTHDIGWLTYTEPFNLTGFADGTYFIDFNSTDNIGNTEPTNTATVTLDNTPPSTTLTIGEPKYASDTTYVTPDTPFTLEATDTSSGVYFTAYRIYNATYDSDWQTYTAPFNLTSLTDGIYSIEYNSTDNVENIETTQAINVTLFSWNYIFEDTYGRGTTLKINLAHKFFQFLTPDNDYGIRNATYMRRCGRAIIIKHYDNELRLITVAVDTKLDFCVAIAWDVQTGKRYFLIDKAGTE
jgi:parallel beta-helix repeat protein